MSLLYFLKIYFLKRKDDKGIIIKYMKPFLIQTFNKEITHDFSFTLIEAIKYKNWYEDNDIYKYVLSDILFEGDYIPIGSVEFVHNYISSNYNISPPKPINIPEELFKEKFLRRECFIKYASGISGNWFVKSLDKIKGFTDEVDSDFTELEAGNYLISEVIDIKSEWRAFVFKNELVGLQNYIGDFTLFPDINNIKDMIKEYKSSPIAYTLDIGICDRGTLILECHNFYSCGFYGFSDLNIIPNMFSLWFEEFIRENK